MELFVSKFVTISNRKILDKNCSEIYFAGTNLCFPFLDEEENLGMEGKYAIDIKEIKSEIDSIKKISKTVIIKNGEPCLQSMALKTLARYIKENNLFLGIETYGTKPNVIKYLLDNNLVDIVTLKLYCPLIDSWITKMNKCSLLTNYKSIIEDIKNTIKILQKSKVKVNVRTIIVPSLLYKKTDITSIAKHIVNINNCTYQITAFKPENCSKFFMHVKGPGDDFMEEIGAYLKSKHPMLRVEIRN